MLIIDPPIGSFSPPEEVRAWISELEEVRSRPGFDEEDHALIEQEIAAARQILARQEEHAVNDRRTA